MRVAVLHAVFNAPHGTQNIYSASRLIFPKPFKTSDLTDLTDILKCLKCSENIHELMQLHKWRKLALGAPHADVRCFGRSTRSRKASAQPNTAPSNRICNPKFRTHHRHRGRKGSVVAVVVVVVVGGGGSWSRSRSM